MTQGKPIAGQSLLPGAELHLLPWEILGIQVYHKTLRAQKGYQQAATHTLTLKRVFCKDRGRRQSKGLVPEGVGWLFLSFRPSVFTH